MASISISERARLDMDEIIDYSGLAAGPKVAEDDARRFDADIDMIVEFSGIGAPRPRYGRGIRMIAERPYLIFYEAAGHNVLVLRVLDGRRRITRKLLRET